MPSGEGDGEILDARLWGGEHPEVFVEDASPFDWADEDESRFLLANALAGGGSKPSAITNLADPEAEAVRERGRTDALVRRFEFRGDECDEFPGLILVSVKTVPPRGEWGAFVGPTSPRSWEYTTVSNRGEPARGELTRGEFILEPELARSAARRFSTACRILSTIMLVADARKTKAAMPPSVHRSPDNPRSSMGVAEAESKVTCPAPFVSASAVRRAAARRAAWAVAARSAARAATSEASAAAASAALASCSRRNRSASASCSRLRCSTCSSMASAWRARARARPSRPRPRACIFRA
mmetsp:Transcript_15709/g.47655  ORF Transcript_15709/g.47655 Transcript_15709/m.47655 type:complete len:298 (-) Transcript_15709:2674-3567(-)|eukprot:scaffold282895_cov28-Tisochrysis_lutea.AAC.7